MQRSHPGSREMEIRAENGKEGFRCGLFSPAPVETIETLSCSLRIIQYKTGHRVATDDILLAWAASRAVPKANRILELGCGKGAVSLLLVRRLPNAVALGLEAHAAHYALAVRNAQLNGLEDRFHPRLGDLRCPEVLYDEPPFELICGAPPFMALGSGVMPRDDGRSAGRFEIRGGIESFAERGARHLSLEGRLVLLMDGLQDDRTAKALSAAGLHLRRCITVCPRPNHQPTYRIYEAAHVPGNYLAEQLHLRGSHGSAWSSEYLAIRNVLDLPQTSKPEGKGDSPTSGPQDDCVWETSE